LSFGSETGRTRSGTKGFSNKTKKAKRKKQEYHSHRRAHFQEMEQLDPEQVRARTTLALDRLGHQIISTEPGGYDLEDWTRNLNSLLDDFQEKIGPEKITDEFRDRRRAAILPLAQPSSASGDIDAEIEALIREEAATRAALDELGKKKAAKLAALREERAACEEDLTLAKKKLASVEEAKKSRSFFSRMTGAGPSTAQAEAKVTELEDKLKRLEEEIETNRKARAKVVDQSTQGGGLETPDPQAKLEGIQTRLGELRSARQAILQWTDERELATKTISDMISAMDLGAPAEKGSS
jgi:hypothetical protein